MEGECDLSATFMTVSLQLPASQRHPVSSPPLLLTSLPLPQAYVGYLLQEEQAIVPLQKQAHRELKKYAARIKAKHGENNVDAFFNLDFLDKFHQLSEGGYARRREARLGRKDKKGDERLSRLRDWEIEFLDGIEGSGMDDDSRDDSDDEEESEFGASFDSTLAPADRSVTRRCVLNLIV